MNQKHSKELVEQFKDLGRDDVSAEEMLGEVEASIQQVFEAYKGKYFLQADFVTALNKSNARINKALHRLMEKGIITRQGSRKKFYYICPTDEA